MTSFLDQVSWNSDGLVPVVTQEAESGRVLMLAWLNREALATAVREGRAVYWSRSRRSLWRKGEESGNVQELVDVYLDCDNDTVCFKVKQHGGIACHTGRESCFFKRLEADAWKVVEPVITEPTAMYGNSRS
ncbi:MAG: phosphoribosyl-AMP cyclohydrolase [Pseudohongiellaceae bacterium]